MYKDRIQKWGLVKNKKEHEMAAILRKKRQRDAIGKQSVLKVRDQVVSLFLGVLFLILDFHWVDNSERRRESLEDPERLSFSVIPVCLYSVSNSSNILND